jgi:hypothetical protein
MEEPYIYNLDHIHAIYVILATTQFGKVKYKVENPSSMKIKLDINIS